MNRAERSAGLRDDGLASPAFGEADLTNCERELIHLAGSVQPHGLLLVLDPQTLFVRSASENAQQLLGLSFGLVGSPVDVVSEALAGQIRVLASSRPLDAVQAIVHRADDRSGPGASVFEGTLHRNADGWLIVELERAVTGGAAGSAPAVASPDALNALLAVAVERLSSANSIPILADMVVRTLREMVGYDRVMVYKFDPDGHGEIIAEARDASLDSLLGHHYPATDIPQRARALYVNNRVRVLVDVNYVPVPVSPDAEMLDMSLCGLRSMSPLHLQYLRNMGVTATLVVSLVREGRLWGLIACHHYSPRQVSYSLRAACGLLAEVISTRISAVENYAQAQGVILVRALEQRLIDATSTDGDWRRALFRTPRTLLQPLDASGAALYFEGEILTTGEVPSTPELRRLLDGIIDRCVDGTFSSASIGRDCPTLGVVSPVASGVLAIELSRLRPDVLVWFRREQLSEITWAGDPNKAVIDNDPLNLSPRRSFAAWSQIVRGTSSPWSNADIALARAIGTTLIDIILQIQAVRLLIAQHQLDLVRVTVENSKEPVLIAGADSRVLYTNEMFDRQVNDGETRFATLDELAAAFTEPHAADEMLNALREQRVPWRGELCFVSGSSKTVPVGVRADMVASPSGEALGYILIFADLTGAKNTENARRELEAALHRSSQSAATVRAGDSQRSVRDEVVGAIHANARIAALDIVDGGGSPAVASLIEELQVATQRATSIYEQLRVYARDPE